MRYSVLSTAGLNGVTLLLPWPDQARGASILVDGVPVRGGDEARTLRHGRPYVSVILSLRAREARTVEIRWQREA